MKNKLNYHYCQINIKTEKEPCGNQCNHCKNYYYPLEQDRKMEDLKEWVESKDLPGINPQTFKIILNEK